MKAFKHIIAMLLAMLTLAGCMAGCTETVPNTPETTPSSSVPASTPKPEEPVEIDPLWREAVIQTAFAYLARGNRIQYDDSRLNDKDYRWQYGVRRSPEEYTSQNVGYTNCAAFVYDVYMSALDMDIGGYTTGALQSIKGVRRVFRYEPTGNESAEEQAAVEAEFRASLQPCDVIVIRYNGSKSGGGHAMLYVGAEVLENVDGYKGTAAEGTDENGEPKDEDYVYDIVHSTGGSYNYNDRIEKYEPYGTIQKMSTDSLFDSEGSRYVFGKMQSITVIRPLNTFEGTVPQHTLNRMENMVNVIAEKLSSHRNSITVNPGENMTFTFSVTNKNEQEVTLQVADVLP